MSDFEIGSIFADRYEILELLGKGGMGMVYRVNDLERKEVVALKTLLPKYARNTQAVRRFNREVEAARRLSHPCVVAIYDSGKHDEVLFYTMEYLEGKSVRSLIKAKQDRKQPMGLGSAVRILSLLCHALEHAHKITIHRDISPENVMVLPNGDVKLLDFGLAKLENIDGDLTRVGISLGKVQYGAPEQRTDAKNVDHRADIYSLGVMFYEMMTNELPLGGGKISDANKKIPKSSDDLYKKATAPNPDKRFQSAQELRLALERLYKEFTGELPAASDEDDADPLAALQEAELARGPESPSEVERNLPEMSIMVDPEPEGSRLMNWLRHAWKIFKGRPRNE